MRWYDLDPDVCMAISMIECSDQSEQVKYAEKIIKLVKEKDTEMHYIKNVTQFNVEHKHQRWYDKNETVSKAFLYLKCTQKELQKDISLAILKEQRECLTA